jgi:hypothetical protein
MDDLLLIGTTDDGTQLYVSELSGRTLAENGIKSESVGVYLYETDNDPKGNGIRVLASMPNMDSAYRMIDLFAARPSRQFLPAV